MGGREAVVWLMVDCKFIGADDLVSDPASILQIVGSCFAGSCLEFPGIQWPQTGPNLLHGPGRGQRSCRISRSLCRSWIQDHPRGDILGDDAARTDDGTLPDFENSPGATGDDHVRSNERFFLYYHPSCPACMGDNDRPDADLDMVLDLDLFGILIVNVNIFADEHALADLDPAEPMQQWPQGRGTRAPAGKGAEYPVQTASEERLFQWLAQFNQSGGEARGAKASPAVECVF